MMIGHSDSTMFQKMADFIGKIHASALQQSQNGRLFCISTAALITNIPLTSCGNEMKFTEKIEKELIYSNNQNLQDKLNRIKLNQTEK